MGPHQSQFPTDGRILLLLLYREKQEPIEGITRLQKLIFLIQQEIEALGENFNYVPYDYGPFSKDLYNVIDEYVEKGYIEKTVDSTDNDNERHTFKITDEGIEFLEDSLPESVIEGKIGEKIQNIKSRYNSRPIISLLDDIYEDYEEYAVESKLYKY